MKMVRLDEAAQGDLGQPLGPIKVFTVIRQRDESGVSGTGRVCDGVVWPSGKCTLVWRSSAPGARPSIVQFDSYGDFLSVHVRSHPTNQTIIKWLAQGLDCDLSEA